MPDEMNGVRVLIRGVGQKDPDVDDGDLAGRADIAGRLDDEVEWIRQLPTGSNTWTASYTQRW
jgi:hypothetical protein